MATYPPLIVPPPGGVLRVNASNTFTWQDRFTPKTAAYTAIDGDAIAADTTAGGFVVTLPATPGVLSRVSILDAVGKFATNNLTVARNGQPIMGLAEDLKLDVNNVRLDLVYLNSTRGWVLA